MKIELENMHFVSELKFKIFFWTLKPLNGFSTKEVLA